MYSNNMEFSTFDADHDDSHGICASERSGGFWGYICGEQNINGHYGGNNCEWWQIIYWWNYHDLKETQLMIRPAA